jgi:hypothetical protein
MKVLDTPRTGRLGPHVAYSSPFGQCFRIRTTPRDPKTPGQYRARTSFGVSSQGWGRKFTELQRQHWTQAALTVPSHPSLGQYSHLSGQQFCVKINSTLRCIGQPPVDEPPAPVVFSPNPVGDLTIDYDEAGNVRLLLAVGAAVEDIMLFAQAPCSAGRMKHRRVNYLSLLGSAANGQCDITAPYVARYGQPVPGQKIFVLTCQTRNGWKAQDHLTSAIVPPRPPAGKRQKAQVTQNEVVAAKETSKVQATPSQGDSLLSRTVYKGSTPDAQGMHKGLKPVHPWSILCTPLVHGFRVAMARLGALGMVRAGA